MKFRRLFKKAAMLGGPQWFGGRQYAVLVDGGPDRAVGQYWHDGHGKWELSVHVSYWRAWWLLRDRTGWFAGWARFPRCCIALGRAHDEHDARKMVEELSGVRMRTPDELPRD